MSGIDTGLFKKYDIRGSAEGDNATLTTEAAQQIGHAFGTYLQRFEQKNHVVVGRDNRRSSFDLAQAAIEGLARSGCHVVDIGLVSTPLVYWHSVHRANAGGLMVTGSHLPPDKNGFKLAVGNQNLYGGQIKLIHSLIEGKQLAFGNGQTETDQTAYSVYIRDLAQRLPMHRPLKVVVDPGNGTGGIFAPTLMQRWGHTLTCIFCEPLPDYPNHQPDPQNPANLLALGEKVREVGADVGIAFDGDADRMGAVDEHGQMIAADRLLALLARDMLARNPGATVIADVLTSQVLFDQVTQAGGIPMMWASGHSLVKAKMAETGALLGGEMSGHIFLAENYFGYDDGYFAAGRLLQLLTASDQPLSAMDQAMPRLFSTPEYRPHCPDDQKERVIDGAAALLEGKGEITDVDGIRVQFSNGWGLLRASNTEPVLSLRFEGKTEADALAYRDLFVEALRQFPQVESFV